MKKLKFAALSVAILLLLPHLVAVTHAAKLSGTVKNGDGTPLCALADDSGLCVEALEGAPGVHSARYAGENATDEERCTRLLSEMRRFVLCNHPSQNDRSFSCLCWARYLPEWPGPSPGEQPAAYIVCLADTRITRSMDDT